MPRSIVAVITHIFATAERSFSNYLRSTIAQERLESLALISIENEEAQSIDTNKLIDMFAETKSRVEIQVEVVGLCSHYTVVDDTAITCIVNTPWYYLVHPCVQDCSCVNIFRNSHMIWFIHLIFFKRLVNETMTVCFLKT